MKYEVNVHLLVLTCRNYLQYMKRWNQFFQVILSCFKNFTKSSKCGVKNFPGKIYLFKVNNTDSNDSNADSSL